MKTPSDSQDSPSSGQPKAAAPPADDPGRPISLATVPPEDTPAVRWARRNVPGADRPGISASELADCCIRYLRQLLDQDLEGED